MAEGIAPPLGRGLAGGFGECPQARDRERREGGRTPMASRNTHNGSDPIFPEGFRVKTRAHLPGPGGPPGVARNLHEGVRGLRAPRVEHQGVKMHAEIDSRVEALDDGDRCALYPSSDSKPAGAARSHDETAPMNSRNTTVVRAGRRRSWPSDR